MDAFRVRLNCIDHYQAVPTRFDPRLRKGVHPSQLSREPRVPVIRVFGSTETGQKVCAHIHGAFPYLFVEYSGSLDPEAVGAYSYRLHLSIDHALAVSYRRDTNGRDAPKYVARITLVKGVPFYGFHVGYRFFLKIYMLNPIVMTRLADLLQQGMIMSRKFQPYEAHLQYLLQFMTDYNLYGCDYINTSKVSFRAPVPRHEDDEDFPHLWHSQSIKRGQITDDLSLPRASHCSIEVDICVQDITNRKSIKERRLHHDFIERISPLPSDVKLVHSMAGLWRDETRRRKRQMRNADPGSSPFPPEVLVSMSADPRDSQPPGWIHEDEYRAEIANLIEQERRKDGGEGLTFEKYVAPVPSEFHVNTALEAVEDLFPQNLAAALGEIEAPPDAAGLNPASSIIVDDKAILASIDDDDDGFFPDDSETEVMQELGEQLEKQVELIDQTQDIKAETQTMAAQHTEQRRTVNGLSRFLEAPLVEGASSAPRTSVRKSKDKPPPEKTYPSPHIAAGCVGVCQSGMVTGRLPQVPITKELIMAAKTEGLASRIPSEAPLPRLEPTNLKRSASHLDETGTKRQRVRQLAQESEPSASAPGEEVRGGRSLPLNGTRSTENAPSQPLEPSETGMPRSSMRKPASSALRFPIVKDPQDPSTTLRLSQLSSSQRSEDEALKKHVSFDPPSMPTQEESSSSGTGEKTPLAPSASSASQRPHLESSLSTVADTDTIKHVHLLIGPPPSWDEVCNTLQAEGVPDSIYQDAFYSLEKDVPPRMREYAGRQFRLGGNTLPFLPEFDASGQSLAAAGVKSEAPPNRARMEQEYKARRQQCTLRSWEIADPPPSFEEVDQWWRDEEARTEARKTPGSQVPVATQGPRPWLSQIEGPTPKNKHGFKYSPIRKSTSVQHETQYMSTMSLELHVNTRGKLVPNPEEDEVQCIFWCVKSDEHSRDSSQSPDQCLSGLIVLSENGLMAQRMRRETSVEVLEEASELDVMVRMVEIVRTHDPDILTGYEVHGSSWGYLIERARFKYDYNLCDEFSRMKVQSHGRFGKEADRWGFNTTSTIRVTGRHMINIWRAMRGELNLLQYTMENVVWHLLHRRIPHYPWQSLTSWYTNGRPRDLSKVLRYYQTRSRLDIEILEGNELIARTSEQARLLGVDFFSVFSRGSQFKVESIMFRIAKPENFLLVSPSRKQVGGQNALECLPLVMEPQSAFYNSPLLVLDFQSLYPSVMIAYNLCYSTFLGRITNWRGMNKMGFTEYKRRQGLLELLKDYINIAPNGMMYVKAEVRKSLLAKMLTEILETRVMVKSGMKQDKDDKTLQQLLNNRQLALKLLANVTYGYTSASFSGRMPCSEIADSIVQTGRETLERAIAYIHSVERWGAEVVYGDTDSLFVYLKGRTRDQAFDIGQEIAKAITDMNPRPVKLKFEKVYHPCVLLAKKRYVGYKYESRDQVTPEFDAKGIETVRRDGTPAEQKIEEKALRMLFETADLSQVKDYFQRQCRKIMRGDVSVQDFSFAKEVKLGSYSERGRPPPGAMVATRRMLEDARAEPQYGERVPYVVVTGAPGARLADRCVAPEDLLGSAHLALDAEYYISKNLIPPLERIFNLVGANVRQWYDEMPKIRHARRVAPPAGGGAPTTTGGPGGQARRRAPVTIESFLRKKPQQQRVRVVAHLLAVPARRAREPGGARGEAGARAAAVRGRGRGVPELRGPGAARRRGGVRQQGLPRVLHAREAGGAAGGGEGHHGACDRAARPEREEEEGAGVGQGVSASLSSLLHMNRASWSRSLEPEQAHPVTIWMPF
ncbi:uncharacterized protein E0L32_004987 [Thyridium curvatum]|uniref:DNA polymerase n=1 Tax=Thyridium curvatum TaxID=1093900 RepID=A0A507BDM9_9PEZI|nr:uncharacterized protein E0L32_004987 [Thyridium curvatum]TPX14878.1 hypothetical protein E0L32_004987 [Thyridium curvatum]